MLLFGVSVKLHPNRRPYSAAT